jgi:hypothetical protein
MGRLTDREVTTVGRLPVTTAPRTLLDLGAVLGRTAVEASISEALRRRLTTVERLRLYLEGTGGKGRRGAKVLGSILRSLEGTRPESVLELRLIRLLRRSGLPQPASQFSVSDRGRLVARVDLAYPEIRLAIEADGYRHHGGHADWKRDLARRNALTGLGWHVVHFTWEDLSTRPDSVVRQVRAAVRTLAKRVGVPDDLDGQLSFVP